MRPAALHATAVSSRRAAVASLIGTTIEWYDFFIYGTAAALVFNKAFFPLVSPLAGTLLAFATFGVGFVARPLGGLAAGHVGDRVGRKTTLVASLLTTGVCTVLVGVLPTYASVGICAPLLLVLLRFVQGLGLGAEWGGAVLLATEHAPAHRKGIFGALPQMGVPAGSVLATLVFTIASTATGPDFAAWGWRVPFLVSIVLVVVGLAVRLSVTESPVFQDVKNSGRTVSRPVLEVLRRHPRAMLLAVGARCSDALVYYVVSLFLLAYATTSTAFTRDQVLVAVAVGSGVELITIPLLGALSDRIGRRPVFLAGAAFTILFAFPFFVLIRSGNVVALWAAVILMFNGGHAPTFATSAALLPEMFPTHLRMSGASISFNISAMLTAAPAPILATALLGWAHGGTWPVSLYLVAGALIALVSMLAIGETYQTRLDRPATDGTVAAGPSLPASDPA